MFDENYMFLTAVKYTLTELRCKIALVPLIGPFFAHDEDKTHPDHDD
jgi:hypothetical protein